MKSSDPSGRGTTTRPRLAVAAVLSAVSLAAVALTGCGDSGDNGKASGSPTESRPAPPGPATGSTAPTPGAGTGSSSATSNAGSAPDPVPGPSGGLPDQVAGKNKLPQRGQISTIVGNLNAQWADAFDNVRTAVYGSIEQALVITIGDRADADPQQVVKQATLPGKTEIPAPKAPVGIGRCWSDSPETPSASIVCEWGDTRHFITVSGLMTEFDAAEMAGLIEGIARQLDH